MQQWFSRSLAELCARRGKRLILWDEALHPTLPREVTVQVWRRVETLEAALAQGHNAILSSPYYLDLAFPAERHLAFSPSAGGNSLVAAQQALLAAPELADVHRGLAWAMARADSLETVTGPARGRTLGGEGCLWGELVDEAVPMAACMTPASRCGGLWSETPESPQDHRERLAALFPVLERTTACEPRPATRACAALGLQANLTVPLRELFEALVPLRWYKRLLGQGLDGRLRGAEAVLRSRDAKTPLTAPVDFVPSESLVLRRLANCQGMTAWVAQGERWLSAIEALSSAFVREGPLPFAPHGHALATLAKVR